ncbi:Glycosyltransferase involved in cell wall bisynthesis (RfaB) (PDB:2IV7) [Commensalibacter communis]|uniref:glycosyltransferase family 4 protein n=1 Tax=Commensalibacter communis TaxID=2972786 RepID=UPI0022FF864C|nr:glycosyltransferase family 4 protein [Commensalibacter communis]CAI3950935.1 Glycosyltransferase involved in cell wall bisynthesis (RfaB) (PDB:2IV7) [Commensalibacter communis]CAI3953452.1 Glycosyltransferase involved in cell wall bisynthesis (RfaB) (PDB:2IV7) [Commensalibacter communis]
MKYLFIHQNFPGQYLHIVQHLAKQKDNEIVFISQPSNARIQGVRSVFYQVPEPAKGLLAPLGELDLAIKRGDAVYQTMKTLKSLGFIPDIIIGHQGWGEMLNLQDIYPDVPVLSYTEFYYHSSGLDVDFDPEFPADEMLPARVRIKNTINLVSATNPGWGQTPTLFQHSTYPDWAQKKITILREGVNLEKCSPDPSIYKSDLELKDFVVKPEDKLVTYVARGLEPYRGFHIFMRALPRLLQERPDVKVVMIGRDQVSYGASLESGMSWRDYMLKEVHNKLDMSRVHFSGQVPYNVFNSVLKRSDAHIYLTYPFVLSWSLREAMSIGCPIIASDTQPVQEFIADRVTGILTPFLDHDALTDRILEVLEDKKLAQSIRKAARAEAERSLSMDEYMKNYETLIDDLIHRRTPSLNLGNSPADRALQNFKK